MEKNQGPGPPIRIRATGTILNPWFMLPLQSYSIDFADVTNRRTPTATRCRVELKEQCLRLFFQDDEVVFVFTGETMAPRYLVNPLRYFLTYQTFINYNLLAPATVPRDDSAFDEVSHIRFRVQRIVDAQTGKDEEVELEVSRIRQFLRVLNPTLYYAIASYLVGCDNPRYFLVDYYKAIEVIKNKLGGEGQFLELLRPYGVTSTGFKEFGKISNDARSAPWDIGRHAPMPGVPVYSVDLRNLLGEPRTREILESSTVFCRQVIDGYFALLIHQVT
jgi:hypothetical protein